MTANCGVRSASVNGSSGPAARPARAGSVARELDLYLALADMLGELIDGERLGRGEQRRLDRADEFVHQAATFSRIGANGSS